MRLARHQRNLSPSPWSLGVGPPGEDGRAEGISDEAAAGVLTSRRTGLRAKCSFLVSVLSSDDSTPSERAIAFVALVDEIDNFAQVLDREDLFRLRDLLDRAVSVQAGDVPWSLTSLPDSAVSGAGAIDGSQVRRVVAPSGSTVEVARIDPPGEEPIVVVNEYTCSTEDEAMVVAVDDDGTVVGRCALGTGHNRLATMTIEPPPGRATSLTLRVESGKVTEPVLWYGATAQALKEPVSLPSLSELLRRELTELRQSSKAPSVFTPVTREPLRMQDIDRMMSLRDAFRGERIFVMGNGPSLNQTPLDLLEDEYVFGVNRVSLLFDRVKWRPTFFTAFDVRVVPDNKEEFASLDIPYKFFSARYKEILGERDNHYWYHTKGFYEGFEPAFEPTVTYSGFGGGGTIATIAIELAFFLGFREIYLIGTDVSYKVRETVKQSGEDEFRDGVKLNLESTEDDDPNHFDPRYFGAGKKWHNPNVRDMKIGFARAAAYVERRGGILRNATVGGELDEVERVSFESLF